MSPNFCWSLIHPSTLLSTVSVAESSGMYFILTFQQKWVLTRFCTLVYLWHICLPLNIFLIKYNWGNCFREVLFSYFPGLEGPENSPRRRISPDVVELETHKNCIEEARPVWKGRCHQKSEWKAASHQWTKTKQMPTLLINHEKSNPLILFQCLFISIFTNKFLTFSIYFYW